MKYDVRTKYVKVTLDIEIITFYNTIILVRNVTKFLGGNFREGSSLFRFNFVPSISFIARRAK